METFESNSNYQESLRAIRTKLIEEAEDLVTNPEGNRGVTETIYNQLVGGERIEKNRALWDMVARIGQDLRINPHQIDAIRSELFLD